MNALRSLSARDRRALLIGALVLLPALLYVWGVRPFHAALGDARGLLAAERLTLSRERAAVQAAADNPGLQQVADSLVRSASSRLFSGRDDVIATAELVSHLGSVARTHDVWLQNATTRPSTVSEAGVRTLHVALRAESDIEGLLRFLRALETGDKLVIVDRLDVSVASNAFSDSGVEPLAISATITGFALPEIAAPAAPTTAPTTTLGTKPIAIGDTTP
jgi:hypothetical protein